MINKCQYTIQIISSLMIISMSSTNGLFKVCDVQSDNCLHWNQQVHIVNDDSHIADWNIFNTEQKSFLQHAFSNKCLHFENKKVTLESCDNDNQGLVEIVPSGDFFKMKSPSDSMSCLQSTNLDFFEEVLCSETSLWQFLDQYESHNLRRLAATSNPTIIATSNPTSSTTAPTNGGTSVPTTAASTDSGTSIPTTTAPTVSGTSNPTTSTPTNGGTSTPTTTAPTDNGTSNPTTTTPTDNGTSNPTTTAPTEGTSTPTTTAPTESSTPTISPTTTPSPTSQPTDNNTPSDEDGTNSNLGSRSPMFIGIGVALLLILGGLSILFIVKGLRGRSHAAVRFISDDEEIEIEGDTKNRFVLDSI